MNNPKSAEIRQPPPTVDEMRRQVPGRADVCDQCANSRSCCGSCSCCIQSALASPLSETETVGSGSSITFTANLTPGRPSI